MLLVAPAAELAGQSREERLGRELDAQLQPLERALLPVHHAKAAELADLLLATLADDGILTGRGSLSVDARTNTLVAVGAAVFVDLAVRFHDLYGGPPSPLHVVAYVISGVGFLGAGAIMKDGAQVSGLNTAATLWGSAAVGACAGIKLLPEAVLAAVFVLAANTLLRPVVNRIQRQPLPEAFSEATYAINVVCQREQQAEVLDRLLLLLEQAQYPVRAVDQRPFGERDVEIEAVLYATTVDGGELGELEYENFNAASATVRITGNNVHPGTAKGSMINSQTLAARFHAAMPPEQTPEATDGYEGFFHLAQMSGTVEESTLHYIIRDFDDDAFAARKAQLKERVASLQLDAPKARITLEIVDNYRNMRSQIAPHPHIVELAKAAMEAADVVPKIKPIRGGTDGARLSFMGLPCPNLFTGMQNIHGPLEWVSVQDMQQATQLCLALVERAATPA